VIDIVGTIDGVSMPEDHTSDNPIPQSAAPGRWAIRFIPNQSEVEAEKQRLERLGFVIIDISMPYFTRHPF
jgi:hypothetical protein